MNQADELVISLLEFASANGSSQYWLRTLSIIQLADELAPILIKFDTGLINTGKNFASGATRVMQQQGTAIIGIETVE